MKKIITLNESDITRIVKRIINEMEDTEPQYLSISEWEEIWYKLRKISKSFHFPENGNFTFGGLFFYYNPDDGSLRLEPQKLTDWRTEPEDAAEVLDNYASRLENFLMEVDSSLKLFVDGNYAMKIVKF